jgi:phenylacetate-coenzyme A ligase PaaK-like adenylate-forming protein
MTTIGDNTVSGLRARFGEALAARLPAHIGRLGWDARQLADHQRDQLRSLLACALERSSFHARRLAGIDPGRFEPGQLAELPVMTKQQMMASFDELITGHDVTRARTEQQLAARADEPGLLDGRYVCLASGGSSGVRGVFVQTAEEYTEFAASVLRSAMARCSQPAARRPAACRSPSSRPPRRSTPAGLPPLPPAVTRCG